MHDVLSDFGQCGVWGVNPYVRCEMRCQYCITGAQGPSVPLGSPRYTRNRISEFVSGMAEPRVFAVGPAVDAYPRTEDAHRVTRAAVETLHELGQRIRVITKVVGVRRDVDILKHPGHSVTISLSTLDVAAARRLEPLAPPPTERLALAHELTAMGVKVEISAAPWIPGVSDAAAILEAAGDLTVRFAALNVTSSQVARTRFAGRFYQADIDRAFRAERARNPELQVASA